MLSLPALFVRYCRVMGYFEADFADEQKAGFEMSIAGLGRFRREWYLLSIYGAGLRRRRIGRN